MALMSKSQGEDVSKGISGTGEDPHLVRRKLALGAMGHSIGENPGSGAC